MIALMVLLAVAPPAPKSSAAKAASSGQLSDAALRERVEGYLGAFEAPVTDAQWQALGPRAGPVLLEVVNGAGLPTRRAKAVAALTALGGSSTPPLLSRLSLDESNPLTLRLAAVRGLARLTSDDRLVEALRPVIEGVKDDRVASKAAELVAKRMPAAGCGLVRARGANGDRFRAALAACAGQ